jgi:hypothetical protein
LDTRLVHPFTTKQYRQPADPDNQTADTDLAAIVRAAAHGVGLGEPAWPEHDVGLRICRRHRCDLVDNNTILRCQSDRVDCANGRLRRRGNRRRRAVLMPTADNRVPCNHYCRAKAEHGRCLGKDACWQRGKVAKPFSRLADAIGAAKSLFPHPCCQHRHYLLTKLLPFHDEHQTPLIQVRQEREAVVGQLPASSRAEEAQPRRERLGEWSKRRGPQP